MDGLHLPNSSFPRRTKWRWVLIPTCSMLAALPLMAYFLFIQKPGIRVTVRNAEKQPLRSVTLYVTGNTYSLGEIPPNGIAHATVKCKGESHLEIEFRDTEDNPKRLIAGGYFEPGYRGTIRLSIKDGEIQDNQQDIKIWAFFPNELYYAFVSKKESPLSITEMKGADK